MFEIIAAVLITCTPHPDDKVDGYFLYSSAEPVESVGEANWENFSINGCSFNVQPNAAVGKCWYITAFGRGPDDPIDEKSESGLSKPACLEIRIKQESDDESTASD